MHVPRQHGSPIDPHDVIVFTHDPSMQLAPPPHDLVLATHLLNTQQPPASQLLSAQHGCPSPPHVWQVPVCDPPAGSHAVVEALHEFGWLLVPAQHDSPTPPHAPHAPAAHKLLAALPQFVPDDTHVFADVQQPPLSQVLSAQHGCAAPPHAVHAPFAQT